MRRGSLFDSRDSRDSRDESELAAHGEGAAGGFAGPAVASVMSWPDSQ